MPTPSRSGPPWGLAVVRGVSMEPTLRAGDRLLVRYGAPVRAGDVVLLRLPGGTVAVKRVTAGAGELLTAESDNSTAPGAWSGLVARADVLGVVRWRVWPVPAPVRRRT